MKKLFLGVLSIFIAVSNSYAAGVEDVYYDIDTNYEYKYELQHLYDKGMFLPSEDRLFNPRANLTRDEFVSIVMEVSCYNCIQPYTEFDVLQKYTTNKPFYDVGLDNKAYYCISLADDLDSVRGYDVGYKCQDGTVRSDKRPFCVNNTITWEESVAVIMRNSGIFSIDDNLSIINQINAGVYFPDIGSVKPKNPDGSANTFYGYFYKAQDYGITKIGSDGNVRNFQLLENITNINPKTSITKEDFLKMAFVAFESNSCVEDTSLQLSTKIEVYENSCEPGKECEEIIIDNNKYGDEYDFSANIGGACESGIKEDNYLWRYYNKTTGEQIVKYGKYQDNSKLTGGNWAIYLTVKDECGNTGEASMTASIARDENLSSDLAIIVKDGSCKVGEECNTAATGNNFDFEVTPDEDGYDYSWTFEDTITGEKTSGKGSYIDNKSFDSENPILVTVVGENDAGEKKTDSVIIYPNTGNDGVDIIVKDGSCIKGEECNTAATGNDFDFEVTPDDDGYDYSWTFEDIITGEKTTGKGSYIDNKSFDGENPILVTVVGENDAGYKKTDSVTIYPNTGNDGVDIIVKDGSCIKGEECNTSATGNNFDFEVTPDEDGYDYSWTFEDTITGEKTSGKGSYIDNKSFDSENPILVTVVGENDAGDKKTDSVTIYPNTGNDGVDIIVKDGSCNAGEDCSTEPIGNVFDLEVDNPKDDCEYSWTFKDSVTGEITSGKGTYIDNLTFDSENPIVVILNYVCQDGESGTTTTTIYPEIDNQAVSIEIRNENCEQGITCLLPNTNTNVYDFAGTSTGINNPSYDWTFMNPVTGKITKKTGEYIDNEVFDSPGVWDIVLTVSGEGGATKSTSAQVIVPNKTPNDLSINISASTLFPTGDTPVEFEAMTSGGAGPYTYVWYFGNGMEGSGKQSSVVYFERGVYTVKAIVTDANGQTAESTITVTATAIDPDGDIDGDGVPNKEDLCLFLEGDPLNKGCPLIEATCNYDNDCAQGFSCVKAPGNELGACKVIPDGVNDCLYSSDITTVIAKLECNSCPCNNSIEFESGLRECDIVFPAITSPDGSQIYKSGSYLQFLK